MQNLANEVANNSPPSATVVDSESEQLSKDYKLHVVRHQRLERYVRALIDSQLAVSDVKGYVIDGRIKDHDGVIKKCLSRGYKSVLQLSDFCGLRVIAQSLEDCERVSWILRTEFEIDVYKSEDKTGEAAATGFGYRSIHLILQLSQPRLAHLENREFTGLTFEIQVRTFLQHGWAEASRDMYKPKNGTPLSAEARRDLTRAAAQLETADELLSRVVSGSKLEPRISLIRQESATEAIPEIGIQISGDSLTNLPVRNSADGSESSRDAIVLFFNSSIAVTQVDTETGLASCQSFVTVDEVPTIKRVSARPYGSNGLVFLGLFEQLRALNSSRFTLRFKRIRLNANGLLADTSIRASLALIRKEPTAKKWSVLSDLKSGIECGTVQRSIAFNACLAGPSHSTTPALLFNSLPHYANDIFDVSNCEPTSRHILIEFAELFAGSLRTRRQETGADLLPARSGSVIEVRISFSSCETPLYVCVPEFRAGRGWKLKLVTEPINYYLIGTYLRVVRRVTVRGEPWLVVTGTYPGSMVLQYECVERMFDTPIQANIPCYPIGAEKGPVPDKLVITIRTSLGPTSTAVGVSKNNLIPRFSYSPEPVTFGSKTLEPDSERGDAQLTAKHSL